ncbi:hypothetical protein [Micromonospora sp. C41]|uniref:hypothetical protein n=1 Tax=Micromonospora sp. C41 TaxID=2824878 RepID=UPI001FFC52A3|nr:hypothetical protein [Micromonospora sp. C41]
MIPSWPPGPRLLGPLLAELRAARGWSQQRLAAELAAMTGRTLVALGRAAAAVPLLTPVVAAPGRPRRSAVYGGWLARAHLGLGAEPEACAVAGEALLDAVRSGSPRAVGQLTEFRRGLARRPPGPATRGYARLLAATRPYLPSRHPWRPSPPVSCEARRDGGTTGAGPNR